MGGLAVCLLLRLCRLRQPPSSGSPQQKPPDGCPPSPDDLLSIVASEATTRSNRSALKEEGRPALFSIRKLGLPVMAADVIRGPVLGRPWDPLAGQVLPLRRRTRPAFSFSMRPVRLYGCPPSADPYGVPGRSPTGPAGCVPGAAPVRHKLIAALPADRVSTSQPEASAAIQPARTVCGIFRSSSGRLAEFPRFTCIFRNRSQALANRPKTAKLWKYPGNSGLFGQPRRRLWIWKSPVQVRSSTLNASHWPNASKRTFRWSEVQPRNP